MILREGRLLQWHPGATENKRRALPAYNPDLLARFVKENARTQAQLLPELHFMDVGARQENLRAKGEPILLQLCLVPAYALTIHKTQALSVKHAVIGCLEGVFAMGQVYVLVSRVTDPSNFLLVGVPPKDLLEDIATALLARGVNVDRYFEDICSVTREWTYDADAPRLKDRVKVKFNSEHAIPVKLKALEEILSPQPDATVVIHRVLDWMGRVDLASQNGQPRPAFRTLDGENIFPEGEEPWWLTDVQKRAEPAEEQPADEDGPASEMEEVQQEVSCSDEDTSDANADAHTPVLAWRA